MSPTVLQINHLGYQDNNPQFEVSRLKDGKRTTPVILTPPNQVSVEGRLKSHLQQDLRWYLEKFLELPTGAYPDLAERVQVALEQWGKDCFAQLFQKQARDWLHEARRIGLKNLTLKIASNDPQVLAWPWEALHDPEGGILAHHCQIERQLRELHDPLPLPDNLPQDQINILLVIARPYGDKDVGFHALSRPLVELTKDQSIPVHIDVLRPPTFEQLRQTLHDNEGFYHIVHFDGHGGYGEAGHPTGATHVFKGTQGKLIFEDEHAQADAVSASVLSQLMAEYRIPIMVLNACQSARIDEHADDAFASVAAALLKAGIRSVVAMGYNLYVSGAQQFVPAFYQRLLATGDVGEATRAGRQEMLAKNKRPSLLGEQELQDWLVPVLYQQMPDNETVIPKRLDAKPEFSFATSESEEQCLGTLPEVVRQLGDYGFIGRERAVQALERARWQQPQAALLVQGMAGIGKTTLAKGFLQWLFDTNGLARDLPNGGVFWFGFDEIRSAEFVINELVGTIFGMPTRAASLEQKLGRLIPVLQQHPFMLVWDNFESAAGIAGTEVSALLTESDRQILKNFVQQLRNGKTKILITSRSPEHWLNDQACYRLSLGGLQGEELWEYCNAVVRDMGLRIDRKQPDFKQLIDELDGHPLALRAILLRLKERSAAELLKELKEQFAGLEGDESTRRIWAALGVFDQGLPEAFAPILQLIGLHEGYVDQDSLEDMLQRAGDIEVVSALAQCFVVLETAGLIQLAVSPIYRMHPALAGYLRSKYAAWEILQRAFVNFMEDWGEHLTPKEWHEQRNIFFFHRKSFYEALSIAELLNMEGSIACLTKALAAYAQNNSEYDEAIKLYGSLVDHYILSNQVDALSTPYHQLGRVFMEIRDFDRAEDFYKKSLKIDDCKNLFGKAINYHQLGRVSELRRNFKQAISYYKKSLVIKNKQENDVGKIPTYQQLGDIYRNQKNYCRAELFFKKALNLSVIEKAAYNISKIQLALGVLAADKQDFSQAEQWYKDSLESAKELGVATHISSIYHNLGILAQEQDDYVRAEYWYHQALLITEKQGNEYESASTYIQLGILSNLSSI